MPIILPGEASRNRYGKWLNRNLGRIPRGGRVSHKGSPSGLFIREGFTQDDVGTQPGRVLPGSRSCTATVATQKCWLIGGHACLVSRGSGSVCSGVTGDGPGR